MNRLIVPLAYRYVALAAMLAEINYCASRLELPTDLPVTGEMLRTKHVSRPLLSGFGGTLETDKFSFVFFRSGILRQIVRVNRFDRMPLRELQWNQSRMKSLITTNEAYQIATNWLTSMSVDVAGLERKHPHSVEQTFFYPDAVDLDDPPERRKRVILLPIFHVDWGNPKEPRVVVSIFGPTKELLGLYQDDDSFSRRPRELLKNMDALLGIADEEFAKYSAEDRRKLISRFAAVGYPAGVVSSSAFELIEMHGKPPINPILPPTRSVREGRNAK